MRIRHLALAMTIGFVFPAALFFFALYLEARKLLYPESPAIEPQPADSPFAKVRFVTADGLTIAAWYAPPPTAAGQAILLLHGHRGNRDQLLPQAEYLLAAGYGALLIDFRHHGESEGQFTSMGCHEIKDARAAYRYLSQQPSVKRIALWGHSMGGAVACQLMSEVDAAGLFVDATFTDFPAVVRHGAVGRGLPASPITEVFTLVCGLLSGGDWNALRPIDQLAAVEKPVLLFHGSEDPAIPVAQAQQIASANPHVRLSIFEGGGHSDLYDLDPDRYRAETLAYLRDAFAAPAG